METTLGRVLPRVSGATDFDAPLLDRLYAWYPGVAPYSEGWGQGFGMHEVAHIPGRIEQGVDNSWRTMPIGNSSHQVHLNAQPSPLYGGVAWSLWLRVYTFPDYTGNYYINSVVLVSQNSSGLWQHFQYGNDYGGQFAPRRFACTQVYNDNPPIVMWNYVIPQDEWIHVTCQFQFAYNTNPGQSRIWVNGQWASDGNNSIDRGGYPPNGAYRYVGPYNYSLSNPGDYALKDFREYAGVITDTDAYNIYQHSLRFHEATSYLIRPDIRPFMAEPIIVVPPGGSLVHQHHHIIGAV